MITQIVGNFKNDAERMAFLANIPSAPAPTFNLVDEQSVAWLRIQAKRDTLKLKGGYKVVVGGVDRWFHSDDFSRSQQLGLMILGANVPAIPWKTMDGTFVTLTPAIVASIFNACVVSDSSIFAVAETHKQNMLRVATPATYDFSTGWPITFLGNI
jgi:hypothetical protein